MYPDLMKPTWWFNNTDVRFIRRTDLPPDDLIGNINVVPHYRGRWVVAIDDDGDVIIPGGTREQNESIETALQRELLEEAGARALDYAIVGMWRCVRFTRQPYRPQMPHPLLYRLVVTAQVELVGAPLNPPDGEQIVEVRCLTLGGVVDLFRSVGRADLADIYRLGAACYAANFA